MQTAQGPVDFDQYAAQYDAALMRGLSVSGEGKLYFAEGRVRWLARCLRELGQRPRRVLDFGCGTGTATPYLLDVLGAERVIGLDVSEASLAHAREAWSGRPAEFHHLATFQPTGDVDLVFCNGVFHHIRPAERPAVVELIYRCVRVGGRFALWENNPWSPGARWVMYRIPFDRDAVMVWPREARQLLDAGGFDVECTDFQFVFPRALRGLRGLESGLAPIPVGAQYQVLARRR